EEARSCCRRGAGSLGRSVSSWNTRPAVDVRKLVFTTQGRNPMKSRTWIVMAAACLPAAAGAQALITERSLSQDTAREAATAALEQCRKNGYHVTVTVLDHSTRTKVVLHDDGANPHTIENSLRKAYTSFTFRIPSGEYGKRATANPT